MDSAVENVTDSLASIGEGITAALPRLGIAAVVLVVSVIGARLLRRVLRPRLEARRSESFGRVMSRLAGWSVVVVGVMVAAATAFPSVDPVDLLAGLGVLSIAVGFAFQDILSNLLAGLLLLVRQPFEAGDQIEVNEHRGTVEAITIRETSLRTFAGERILMPNKDVYQSAVRIDTAFDTRRTSLLVGVGYDTNLDAAVDLALETLDDVDGVRPDPQPQAYLTEFGDSAMTIDLRYWTGSEQAEVRRVQHEVVVAVKKAYDDAGIDIPFPIRTLDAGSSFLRAMRPGSSTDAVAEDTRAMDAA